MRIAVMKTREGPERPYLLRAYPHRTRISMMDDTHVMQIQGGMLVMQTLAHGGGGDDEVSEGVYVGDLHEHPEVQDALHALDAALDKFLPGREPRWRDTPEAME